MWYSICIDYTDHFFGPFTNMAASIPMREHIEMNTIMGAPTLHRVAGFSPPVPSHKGLYGLTEDESKEIVDRGWGNPRAPPNSLAPEQLLCAGEVKYFQSKFTEEQLAAMSPDVLSELIDPVTWIYEDKRWYGARWYDFVKVGAFKADSAECQKLLEETQQQSEKVLEEFAQMMAEKGIVWQHLNRLPSNRFVRDLRHGYYPSDEAHWPSAEAKAADPLIVAHCNYLATRAEIQSIFWMMLQVRQVIDAEA